MSILKVNDKVQSELFCPAIGEMNIQHSLQSQVFIYFGFIIFSFLFLYVSTRKLMKDNFLVMIRIQIHNFLHVDAKINTVFYISF